jgi:hypothetical protein
MTARLCSAHGIPHLTSSKSPGFHDPSNPAFIVNEQDLRDAVSKLAVKGTKQGQSTSDEGKREHDAAVSA